MKYNEFVEKSKDLEMRYKVTQDVYDHFQKMCGDLNPLHTQEDFAKSKGYPHCVMYGNILNGFVSNFVGMALPSSDVMIQTQDIQYRKPVYMGDDLLLQSSVEKTSEAVEIINFKLKFYRLNEDGKELVATGHVQIGMLHNKI